MILVLSVLRETGIMRRGVPGLWLLGAVTLEFNLKVSTSLLLHVA